MFFRRQAGHGLKPVRKMGHAAIHGPLLHGMGHGIGHILIQTSPFFDGGLQTFVNFLRQAFLHYRIVKGIDSKIVQKVMALSFGAHLFILLFGF